jgi:hypothetical protein
LAYDAGPSSFGNDEKVRTCSSKVNLAASSLALSVGCSSEKTFLPAMACSSDGEFCSGVVAGVSSGTGCTWMAACFKSMCLTSPSAGLASPRFILVIANIFGIDVSSGLRGCCTKSRRCRHCSRCGKRSEEPGGIASGRGKDERGNDFKSWTKN